MFNPNMTPAEKLNLANSFGMQTLVELVIRLCYWVPVARQLTEPFWASPATGELFDAVETLCEGLKQFRKEYTL